VVLPDSLDACGDREPMGHTALLAAVIVFLRVKCPTSGSVRSVHLVSRIIGRLSRRACAAGCYCHSSCRFCCC